MMTVITRVKLAAGSEAEWDQAMQERLKAAPSQQGWIGGQLLAPEGSNERVIVGTWESRENWKAWHEDPAFQETRQRLEGLQQGPDEMEWFEVVTEAREQFA
ncbi:MAG TPA: antibiotic biosynthesis monooxygenase [Acidimicrobiia bacterium]|nr:antibiotic biosynthesis monooxygenase [Acidimicrobiia bacterium]